MEIKKLEYYDKLNLVPELITYYHPKGDLQVALRSPAFLKRKEDDEYMVYRIQASKHGVVFHPEAIYEMTKTMMKSIIDLYYDCLEETEMYCLPEEMIKSKIGDTLITIEEEQS